MRRTIGFVIAMLAFAPRFSQAVVYNLPPDVPPATLAAGDAMNVYAGAGTVDQLDAAAGSTINVHGGAMGLLTYTSGEMNIYGGKASSTVVGAGATVNLVAGEIPNALYMNADSTLNMSGGKFAFLNASASVINLSGGNISVLQQLQTSTLNMTGGQILLGFRSVTGSTINLSGGTLGDDQIGGDSRLNFSGGSIAPKAYFAALADSTVHLIARAALLNGTAIPGLSLGNETAIDLTNITGTLNGILKDGSPFSFALRLDRPESSAQGQGPIIVTNPSVVQSGPPRSNVKVLITLVPEPSSASLVALCAGSVLMSVGRRRQPARAAS